MKTIATRTALMAGALLLIGGAARLHAEPRREAIVVAPRIGVYRPYYYGPYWGPWHPYAYTYVTPAEPAAPSAPKWTRRTPRYSWTATSPATRVSSTAAGRSA